MIGKSIVVAASALCFALFAGCATTTNPVSVFYSPSTESRGGSGYLFLRVPSVGKTEKVRWVIGKQKDADGEVIGEVLSANSREDIVADALKRELTAAGYRVESGASLPAEVTKALDLTLIRVELNETVGVTRVEAQGRVKLALDVWKNGVLVKKLSYQSETSDFATLHRDRLPREVIESGLHEVMGQAVPDIVSTLEGKTAR